MASSRGEHVKRRPSAGRCALYIKYDLGKDERRTKPRIYAARKRMLFSSATKASSQNISFFQSLTSGLCEVPNRPLSPPPALRVPDALPLPRPRRCPEQPEAAEAFEIGLVSAEDLAKSSWRRMCRNRWRRMCHVRPFVAPSIHDTPDKALRYFQTCLRRLGWWWAKACPLCLCDQTFGNDCGPPGRSCCTSHRPCTLTVRRICGSLVGPVVEHKTSVQLFWLLLLTLRLFLFQL